MCLQQDRQESPNWNWQNLFRDKSGKESLKRVMGSIGFIIFVTQGTFMMFGILDPSLKEIVISGLAFSAGSAGVGTLTKSG